MADFGTVETPSPTQCEYCKAYNNMHYQDCVFVVKMPMPVKPDNVCFDCGAHADMHYSDCRRVLYEKMGSSPPLHGTVERDIP